MALFCEPVRSSCMNRGAVKKNPLQALVLRLHHLWCYLKIYPFSTTTTGTKYHERRLVVYFIKHISQTFN